MNNRKLDALFRSPCEVLSRDPESHHEHSLLWCTSGGTWFLTSKISSLGRPIRADRGWRIASNRYYCCRRCCACKGQGHCRKEEKENDCAGQEIKGRMHPPLQHQVSCDCDCTFDCGRKTADEEIDDGTVTFSQKGICVVPSCRAIATNILVRSYLAMQLSIYAKKSRLTLP